MKQIPFEYFTPKHETLISIRPDRPIVNKIIVIVISLIVSVFVAVEFVNNCFIILFTTTNNWCQVYFIPRGMVDIEIITQTLVV